MKPLSTRFFRYSEGPLDPTRWSFTVDMQPVSARSEREAKRAFLRLADRIICEAEKIRAELDGTRKRRNI